jgi:DNA-binding NarL/FixJ family response regulator
MVFGAGVSDNKVGRLREAMNVLVADDSPLVRERLVRLLVRRQPDAQVRETWDVLSTIASIDSGWPDALILDLCMPDGSGFDVLRHIQQYNVALRVIVLTNFASEVNQKRSLKLGAHFFFDKTKEFDRALDALFGEIPGKPSLKQTSRPEGRHADT